MLLALMGCGGSPSGAPPDLPATPPAVTDPRDLPASGFASYDGYLRARLPTGADGARLDYLGDLRMDVNFGAGFDQIRGTATGFRAERSTALAGTLTLDQGKVFRDPAQAGAYGFDADLNGRLTGADGVQDIDAALSGNFLGPDAAAVSGVVYGTTTGAAGLEIFDGSFAADRQPD